MIPSLRPFVTVALALGLWLAVLPPVAGPASAADLVAATDATVTRHRLQLPDRTIAYTASVETFGLPEEDDTPTAQVTTIGYVVDDADPRSRPVAFVVNGGPGAASAFLHLGGLGPVRLAFAADGSVLPGPPTVSANAATWLAFTDLVFVDPVGTGHSRAVAAAEGEQGGPERELWSVAGDLKALGATIRQWIGRHERWSSPKLLVGESYGGFRMAALAERLPQEFEVAVDGVVLISPALELALQQGTAWELLPWIVRVPSMAAVARAQGKAEGGVVPEPRAALADAEAFAIGPLLAGLARGASLPAVDREALTAELARMVGLPAGQVARDGGRIGVRGLAERLLEGEGRVVSLYDGAQSTPRGPGGRDDDVLLAQMTAALAAATAQHLRTALEVTTAAPYRVLNREVFRAWSWDGEGGRGRGRAGSAAELARALTGTPGLRVLVAHGAHDLVTPYLASAYLIDQLVTDPAARQRIRLAVYPGGHMFYTRPDSLAQFRADVAALVAEIRHDSPGG